MNNILSYRIIVTEHWQNSCIS